MKLLLTGDKHIRLNKPVMRKDLNYFETQKSKEKQIIKIAKDNDYSYIVQPGDYFDSFDTPYTVIREYITLYKREFGEETKIVCVAGQHDQRFHTQNMDNTPLGILNASKVVNILNEPFIVGNVTFYGASWKQPIPEIINENQFNILVMHRMIIKDEKIWFGQENFDLAKDLLKKHKFDLIVSGDNHSTFFEEYEGKTLVNCGSLMRSRIDQESHKPIVVIFDTETKELNTIELDVLPSKEVFDLSKRKKEIEKNSKLEAFVKGLEDTETQEMELDFVKNLYEIIRVSKEQTKMKGIADEFLAKHMEKNNKNANLLSGGMDS